MNSGKVEWTENHSEKDLLSPKRSLLTFVCFDFIHQILLPCPCVKCGSGRHYREVGFTKEIPSDNINRSKNWKKVGHRPGILDQDIEWEHIAV